MGSSNGTSRTEYTIGNTGVVYNYVYNKPSKYIAVGDAGKLAISTDGTTWVSKTLASIYYEDIDSSTTSNGGRWVIVGSSGGIATALDVDVN